MNQRKNYPNLNPKQAHIVISSRDSKPKKKRISITDESIFKRDIIADEYRHEQFTNAMYQLEIDAKIKESKK